MALRPTTQLSIHLETEDAEDCRYIAQTMGVSLATVIRWAVESYLHDKPKRGLEAIKKNGQAAE